MLLRNHRDLYAGLMFIAIGLFFAIAAQQYQLGTAASMGPGYFPTLLGIVLIGLGAITTWGAFSASSPELRVERIVWQPQVFVLGSVLLFAATLQQLGYVLAMLLLIFTASFAAPDSRLRDTGISYVVLLLFSWGVFIQLLEVQFPTWPAFLTD